MKVSIREFKKECEYHDFGVWFNYKRHQIGIRRYGGLGLKRFDFNEISNIWVTSRFTEVEKNHGLFGSFVGGLADGGGFFGSWLGYQEGKKLLGRNSEKSVQSSKSCLKITKEISIRKGLTRFCFKQF